MENADAGVWSDNLNPDEVNFTKKCANKLSNKEGWCNFLNGKVIKNAVNTSPNLNRTKDELYELKSALFEVRIAFLVYRSGLNAEYEFNPNAKGNKTVDFRVFGNQNISLLVELSSLRESKSQKNQTGSNGDFFGCLLMEDNEVAEYCKTQKVLIEKAEKFPSKIIKNQFNVIILDMRSSIIGQCDDLDYRNILYGSKNLDCHAQHYTNDGKLFPGIFCSTHPADLDEDLVHLRKSIHYFGFAVEEKYTQDELATKIQWFKNPDLVILSAGTI